MGGENGQRGEMINEAGNELRAITVVSPILEDCTLSPRKKDCLSNWGAEKKPIAYGMHKLTFSYSHGINYSNKISGGAKINVVLL